jgi:hypothetical protein
MANWRLDRVLEFLTSMELVVGLLWAGLAAFTVTLLVLMRTRWGQDRPLRKCVVLSLLAHLLLVGYATTVQIVAGYAPVEEPVIHVTLGDGGGRRVDELEQPVAEEQPWAQMPLEEETVPQPDPVPPEREEVPEAPEPERSVQTQPGNVPGSPPLDHVALSEPPQPEGVPRASAVPIVEATKPSPAAAVEAPAAERRDPPRVPFPEDPSPRQRLTPARPGSITARQPSSGVPSELIERLTPAPRLEAATDDANRADALAGSFDRLSRPGREESIRSSIRETARSPYPLHSAGLRAGGTAGQPAGPGASGPSANPDAHRPGTQPSGPMPEENAVATAAGGPRGQPDSAGSQVPSIYRLRTDPDRSREAEKRGATAATESAVEAALKWFAENQEADGRWNAGRHGAGREDLVLGRNRLSAGVRADTGMTGLALLAFLASGHTHLKGEYRENVRRGLEYLLRAQSRDGDLGGQATAYARMYCHSMAAFAISEAYGMTRDHRLRPFVQRAVNYTVAAQDPTTGGYRYNPGDPGDTSQAGWQLMALKSAELAGVSFPVKTRNGLVRYLRSVSAGEHGGLAAYRSGDQVTRPMTAEAMVCWQFLGLKREHPACDEAGDYLMGELPGQGEANLYYWYYGTLATYQLGGPHWEKWNEALTRTLVASQRKEGPLAGSWDPNTVWGGYGGRVYSTALATLCLEVYYRYLPLYIEARPGEAGGEGDR